MSCPTHATVLHMLTTFFIKNLGRMPSISHDYKLSISRRAHELIRSKFQHPTYWSRKYHSRSRDAQLFKQTPDKHVRLTKTQCSIVFKTKRRCNKRCILYCRNWKEYYGKQFTLYTFGSQWWKSP
jgi:hypothetical protein